MVVVTVAERKAIAIERMRRAGAVAVAELRRYAIEHGVQFSIFGSFARGDLVPESDFDLMVDGPDDRLRPARDAAEMICEQNGLRPDVHLAPEVSDRLRTRVTRDAIALP